jgi:SpoVK/Ycf46/Vps4 family AAA+-type ATPase
MGEKLFAQRLLGLLRNTVGSGSREAAAALEWATDERDWLWPGRAWASAEGGDGARLDWQSLPVRLDEIDPAADGDVALFDGVRRAAELLELSAFDRDLLNAVVAFQRLPRLSQLRLRLIRSGSDFSELVAQVAGAPPGDAASLVRRSATIALGLVEIERGCGPDLELTWRFGRILDEAQIDDARMIDRLAGVRQSASLTRADFAELNRDFDLLVRLLKGALARSERGISVLIYGPPGTGKTELARTVAAEVGAALFAVGEADVDGEEPTRSDRLLALNRAQRVLARKGNSILLFDEMEDLFTEAAWSVGGDHRAGSKIFVNRLLEEVAVPVIWTSNSLNCIDAAHLRRLSYVLRMSHASPKARARIAARAAEAAGVEAAAEGLAPLLDAEPEAASIAPAALRTVALADGSADDAAAAARSLLLGIRGGRALPPAVVGDDLDLSLYSADLDLDRLVRRVSKSSSPTDFSLLLTGPPGTGKTAFAAHLARRLDRPLAVKRASDLLSMWVGGSEANIAAAFAEARDSGSVLLFDEADSLLLDRRDARHSWEITQVNELLTWMDNHPLPFVAATNFARRLDPAALRRFVFKVELEPLSADLLRRAFVRFFDRPPPAELSELRGLTPGDFAVVKRQLRYRSTVATVEIVAMLRHEAEAKPGLSSRLGF